MPDTNAFSGASDDQTTAPNPATGDQPNVATQKTYTFQEGDRVKTFTGSDDIFNAYTNSQQFIGTLKNEKTAVELELEALKSKYSEMSSQQVSTQDVLNQIQLQQNNQQVETQVAPTQTQAPDQNDIVTAVREQLTLEANVTQANSALTSVYGDSAAEHVAKVAGDNGMSVQEAQKLAGSNPRLFKTLFLPTNAQNAAPSGFSTPQSSVSTAQANSDPATLPEKALMWQMKEGDAVKNLRSQREEMRKQLQL